MRDAERRRLRATIVVGLGLGLGTAAGCLTIDPFQCQNDQQCVSEGVAGRCILADQTCVYPDATCVSTLWSTADGTCVVGPPGTTASDSDDSGGPPGEGSTDGTDPDAGEATSADGTTSGPPPGDSSDDDPTDPTTGSSGTCAGGPTDDITALGVVSANSVFNDDFQPFLAVDGNLGSSWFSSGPEPDGMPTLFTWTELQPHCITQILVTGNGLHENPDFRQDYGFEHMIVRVYDEADTIVFQQMFAMPGTPDPPVIANPEVEGVKVELELYDHESNNCGGFSELEITGT